MAEASLVKDKVYPGPDVSQNQGIHVWVKKSRCEAMEHVQDTMPELNALPHKILYSLDVPEQATPAERLHAGKPENPM